MLLWLDLNEFAPCTQKGTLSESIPVFTVHAFVDPLVNAAIHEYIFKRCRNKRWSDAKVFQALACLLCAPFLIEFQDIHRQIQIVHALTVCQVSLELLWLYGFSFHWLSRKVLFCSWHPQELAASPEVSHTAVVPICCRPFSRSACRFYKGSRNENCSHHIQACVYHDAY